MGMDSLNPSVPRHTHLDGFTPSELFAAIVWLASGYQEAINLADNLLRAPAVTTALPPQERAIVRDAIAQQRAEFSAVRVHVASVLDEVASLRPVPDRRHLKAASKC